MASQQKVTLPGSELHPHPAATRVGAVNENQKVTVSVFLRRRPGHPPVEVATRQHVSHSQFPKLYGAAEADVALVEAFAKQNGLHVENVDIRRRRVRLTGTLAAMSKAFETDLSLYRLPSGGEFRGRSGVLSIPKDLDGVVTAVLGLDTRPIAIPHFRIVPSASPAATPGTFTPPQMAALYNFPTNADGSGQTIAIIELGGGYNASDLTTFFQGVGINEPSVTTVSVDGGTNSPGSNADGEVELDIEVAGSVAPGAKIVVYFAPNTDQGFIDAITDAAHDTTHNPSVISISWGGPEDSWTQQSQTAMNNALQDAATLGVTVTVAAGDSGSTDGVGDNKLHVDFPASSPYALACGGTTVVANGNAISSETVWNEIANQEGATGGGVSNLFALPSYQSSAGVPANPETKFVGRGVPDVAGDADPSTGYQVVIDGQPTIVGGTSAVAPLWAGLIALFNQTLGKRLGFVNPALYAAGSSFNDITSGNNDDSGLGYYSAGANWDACTGLGSPNGAALLSALQSSNTAGSGS